MARWLSLHVRYACRHAGACCSSGWPIPLEHRRVPTVARAIDEGRLSVADSPWLLPVADQPDDVAGVLATRDGRCVFHQAETAGGGRRCAIQAACGHASLPASCRHFPRVCLIDDRGVSVTLSHYCPTAAALLSSHEGPVTIVDGPDPVPGGTPEGLDARGAWPPLLAPGVLMDLASYTLWESHLVSWLGGVHNQAGRWSPDEVLPLIEGHAHTLATWRPGGGTLAAAVRALASEAPIGAERAPQWEEERRLRTLARQSLPGSASWAADVADLEEIWRRDVETAWRAECTVTSRLLAAHAFASWTAYQADGVLSHVHWLRLVVAVLREEAARMSQRDGGSLTQPRFLDAIRQTDLLLVHLADRTAVVRRLSRMYRDRLFTSGHK